MNSARASVQAAFEAHLRNVDHRRAAAEAADAFRSHDFSRLVAVLEPLEHALTPAERKAPLRILKQWQSDAVAG